MTPAPDRAPGQDSVWSYPRPAMAEPTERRLRILYLGETVAEIHHAVRALETSHPLTY